MPTGLTADIYDGSDTSMRAYLMHIGRHMGFAVMQRDDPRDTPIKRVEPHTSYYDESLATNIERRAWLDSLNAKEIAGAAQRAYEDDHGAWFKRRAEKAELQKRYEQMIRQVEAWEPGELLQGVKDLALEQLRQSIDFDCGGTYDTAPEQPDPYVWLSREIAACDKAVQRAHEGIAEEIARTAERNRYIDAFYAALPDEVAACSS